MSWKELWLVAISEQTKGGIAIEIGSSPKKIPKFGLKISFVLPEPLLQQGHEGLHEVNFGPNHSIA